MSNFADNLAVIIPVYNEQDVIESVIDKWVAELSKLGIDYKIFAYNDGSKDNTKEALQRASEKYEKVEAINKQNSGHGPTILTGYKEKSKEYAWIFQMDSDDEMGPESFHKLWENRKEYDFLIGRRESRIQPISRKIISSVSRLCVRIFYGKGVWDVNSPYRLMHSEKFSLLFDKIPQDTFAPNVIVSGFAAKKKLKFYEIPVVYSQRTTGEVSIKKFKLFKSAVKSFWQTIKFLFSFVIK